MESDPNVRAAMELWSAVTAAYWPYSKDLNRKPFIRLVQEYGAARADERAEEIAKAIEARSLGCAHLTGRIATVPGHCPWCATREVNAAVARSTITKPKTREQRLESALRNMPCTCNPAVYKGPNGHTGGCAKGAAIEALK